MTIVPALDYEAPMPGHRLGLFWLAANFRHLDSAADSVPIIHPGPGKLTAAANAKSLTCESRRFIPAHFCRSELRRVLALAV